MARDRGTVRAPSGLLVAILLGLSLILQTSAATAATKIERYTPFDASGEPKPSLRLSSETGECPTSSNKVRDALRCFTETSSILDPCFPRSDEDDGLICVQSPWATTAVELFLTRPIPDDAFDFALSRGALPWAVELVDRQRCTVLGGATVVVRGRRLNYACGGGRYLFGGLDKRRPDWRIRHGRGPNGRGMRFRAIAVVWR